MSRTDSRYRQIRVLRAHTERTVIEAQDTLTLRPVILKSGSKPVIREYRTMLALPPGVAARIVDAMWQPPDRLTLVLERLEGASLLEAAPHLTNEQLPAVCAALCQSLARLHQAGFIHGDVRPENTFVRTAHGRIEVHLIDFGLAAGRSTHPLADGEEESEGGGTHPFVAPEILGGWVFDERADQYALSLTLTETLPGVLEDERLSRLLGRMRATIPADRFPNMVAARREIEETFGLSHAHPIPEFGSGPLHGRADLLRDIADRVHSHPSVWIALQARNGSGLSRLLHEAVHEIARRGGPAVRLLDLGQLDLDSRATAELLRQHTDAGRSVLLGIPDPSPSLRRLAGGPFDWLRSALADAKAERVLVRPLDESAFVEITAESLGSGGGEIERLGRSLREKSDGDLRVAAEGFSALVASSGSERGLAWDLDPLKLKDAIALWRPASPGPHIDDVESDLRPALVACSRIGRAASRQGVEALCERFAARGDCRRLLSSGWLLPENDGRVEFASEALWHEAAQLAYPRDAELDHWLNDHARPDIARVNEVLVACARAQRVGTQVLESEYLRGAIELAFSERRVADLIRLLVYPDDSPEVWTVGWAIAQADRLREILRESVSSQRLLFYIAFAMSLRDPHTAQPLLERVSAGSDSATAADGRARLLERATATGDADGARLHLAALEKLAQSAPPVAGRVDFYRALKAQTEGRTSQAGELAARAVELLKGTGDFVEPLSLQLMAIDTFVHDPRSGIALMEAAVRNARNAEQEAQLRHNLAQMYGRMGDPRSADCAQAGIERLRGRASGARIAALRLRRAWAWAEQDRVSDAAEEAAALLSLQAVRQSVSLTIPARLLAGYCLLCTGAERAAVSQIASTWQEARTGCGQQLRIDGLQLLVDTLLDLEAWRVVREHASELGIPDPGEDATATVTIARAAALREQATGHPMEALDILTVHEETAQALSWPLPRARFCYHAGVVHLAVGKRGSSSNLKVAKQRFDEALAILGEGRYGYWRARSLERLAAVEFASGQAGAALQTLSRAIELARKIGSRAVLRHCLRARAPGELTEVTDHP